jgi:hypothetical protein
MQLLAVDAMRAAVTQLAANAVGAGVAALTFIAEHAVGAAQAAGAGVAARVTGVGGEQLPQLGEFVEKPPLIERADEGSGGLGVEMGFFFCSCHAVAAEDTRLGVGEARKER